MGARKVPTVVTCAKQGCSKEGRWVVEDDCGRPNGVFCGEHADEQVKMLDEYEARLNGMILSRLDNLHRY